MTYFGFCCFNRAVEMASEARVVELLGSVLVISSAVYIVAIIKKKDSLG